MYKLFAMQLAMKVCEKKGMLLLRYPSYFSTT